MAKNIDYKSEYWLYDQYVNKEKSLRNIARDCGVVVSTVHWWLRKFNIQPRKTGSYNGNNHWRWGGGLRSHCYRESRRVWEKFWDISVQKGYVIHHVDRNITNNDICNLVLLTWSEHTKIHWRDRKNATNRI